MLNQHNRPEPEDFIVEFAHLVPPGAEILDVGAGSGRHSIFFAQRDCRVFAIERDLESVEKLKQLGINAANGDIENASLLPGRFDAIVNTFFLYRPLLAQYIATLRPNGVLFFRTFTDAHMDVLGHVKPRREFLLRAGELAEAFGSLEMIHSVETLEPNRAIATVVARKRPVVPE